MSSKQDEPIIIAYNENGKQIDASKAKSGGKYMCVNDEDLVYVKETQSKIAHFRHKEGTYENCGCVEKEAKLYSYSIKREEENCTDYPINSTNWTKVIFNVATAFLGCRFLAKIISESYK